MPWSAATWKDLPYRGDSGWLSIINATRKMVDTYGLDVVVPLGTAVQNARSMTQFQSDNELTRDGRHLSFGVGRYIGACTFFEALIAPVFGTTIMDNPAIHEITEKEWTYTTLDQQPVTDENRLAAQQCAINAVSNPWMLSQ